MSSAKKFLHKAALCSHKSGFMQKFFHRAKPVIELERSGSESHCGVKSPVPLNPSEASASPSRQSQRRAPLIQAKSPDEPVPAKPKASRLIQAKSSDELPIPASPAFRPIIRPPAQCQTEKYTARGDNVIKKEMIAMLLSGYKAAVLES